MLIDGLVKIGQIGRAWQWFWNMRTWRQIEPDAVLFTVMIKACAKRGEAERALNLLEDLRTCGQYPTDVTYTELIHACARSPQHFEKAFYFFASMQAEDLPVTGWVCEHLLLACRTTGNVPKARSVVQD